MLTEHSTRAPSPRKTEPFAALPHTACVSNLSDAAYRVLGAVLYFARKVPATRPIGSSARGVASPSRPSSGASGSWRRRSGSSGSRAAARAG